MTGADLWVNLGGLAAIGFIAWWFRLWPGGR